MCACVCVRACVFVCVCMCTCVYVCVSVYTCMGVVGVCFRFDMFVHGHYECIKASDVVAVQAPWRKGKVISGLCIM